MYIFATISSLKNKGLTAINCLFLTSEQLRFFFFSFLKKSEEGKIETWIGQYFSGALVLGIAVAE